MNNKIKAIFENYHISLSEEDKKSITSKLDIKDLRKNPTEKQEEQLNQVCKLIGYGKNITHALAEIDIKTDDSDSSLDFDAITELANRAADAALLSLPNLAQAEMEGLRAKFIEQFRIRVQQQLLSPEFKQKFVEQIECLGELTTSNNSSPNMALPSS